MKQVIVVNRSLALPKGKLAAQVAHAAVGAFVEANTQAQAAWLQLGMPKIVVYAADADALLQLEMLEQGDGVVCHLLIAQGAINVGGVSMPLLLDGNDLAGLGKDRQHLGEVGFNGRKSAVQQDQRQVCALPRAVNFIIHIQTVDGSVAALDQG